MKLSKLCLTTLSVAALSLSLSSAQAEGGKVIAAPSPGPIAPAPQLFGGNVTVGYDSHYMFRGVNYGEDSVWGSVEWVVPFTPEFVELTVGAWYQNPINGSAQNPAHGDELDLYATAAVEVAPGVSVWLGYAAYTYPDDSSVGSTNEVGTGVDFSVMNMIDIGIAAYYDIDIEGWYFSTSGSHTVDICDGFAVTAGASIGYQNDYNNVGDDWNDIRAFVEFPIELTDRATLTPYISHSWALDAIDSYQGDELFGGVALSVNF